MAALRERLMRPWRSTSITTTITSSPTLTTSSTVGDVVSIGDEVMVVVIEVDRQGRINLSRKAAMQRHLAKEPVAVGEG